MAKQLNKLANFMSYPNQPYISYHLAKNAAPRIWSIAGAVDVT